MAGAQVAPEPTQRGNAPAATLKQAFDAAWARQPEAAALGLRRDAAQAAQQAARAWTPEPWALSLSAKTDQLQRNEGVREYEIGVAVPLWLPGERARRTTLAEAETSAIESRVLAARLRLAGALRDAWWQFQRAQSELDTARDQLANARALRADVGKRLNAGDLARADQHQADGAVAAGEAAEARAIATRVSAGQQFRAASGSPMQFTTEAQSLRAEAEPSQEAVAFATGVESVSHPVIKDLVDRAGVAESAAALAATRSRANPEVSLAATQERGVRGDRYDPSITLGLRIPLGAGSRHTARVATAQAEATELQVQLALERDRVVAEQAASAQRVVSARTQAAAADQRAQLADESRGFFDKSFRLGETDLPTRLRIEAEAVEARRQAGSARIEVAAAISQWRQALGLLPE